jgi:hypothetical protein
MDVLLEPLEEELPEKTKKERISIAESIVEALDGTILNVEDAPDEAEDEDESESYERD